MRHVSTIYAMVRTPTDKTWEEFIARQVEAELLGTRITIYKDGFPTWKTLDATELYIFGEPGHRGAEYWHVNVLKKLVCRFQELD